MQRYLKTGAARVLNRRIEITAIDKAGREFPIELSIIAMPDGASAFVGFVRDISDRRQAQERLMLSEESLRLATEAAEVGTWDLDLVSNVLTWSDRTKAMFGISPDVPCSMEDFYAGLHPEDRQDTSQAFASALNVDMKSTYDVQYRTIGKEDGLVRWIAAKGKGIFSDDGRCVRAVGTAIDITARKLADARHAFMLQLSDVLRDADTHAALSEVSALMGQYFGVSRVGYGKLNPVEDVFDYSVCWTDGSVPLLLGRFPASAFGKKVVAKLGAGETVVIEDILVADLTDEPATRTTAVSVDTRAILVVPFLQAGRLSTIVYLNDRSVRCWANEEVGFMKEIAERTRQVMERAEAEAALLALNATLEARVEERTLALRSTEDALRQSQKMEAIGQLTGGIAHDFNNLLQGITGSLDLMQKRLSQGRTGELDRFITGALASAQRASALTHRLLAFSRRQPLDPRSVRANALIASMEDLLRRTIGESIDLRLSLREDAWVTLCDPNQLENAILNLAINARDAMPDGGRLTIETSNAEVDDATALLNDMRAAAYVSIRVADTGSGMDAETAARAFEPFFTTKPTGQGTGLGLSMIYGFARQSNGHVKVRSKLGQGSEFVLYLPRHDADPEIGAASKTKDAPKAAQDGEVVLVVEDEPIVRALIIEVLNELGYRSLEAADGPTGLEILRSRHQIDLLITDIGLPGLNGRQVADAARVLRPHLKVLFMTGYAETAASASGFLDSGMAMITKPFGMEALAARIREVIAQPVRAASH